MKEYYYDKLLNIKTSGDQNEASLSFHYHRYEPTPYYALEQLFQQYELKSSDRVVDFGCGKGRLNFFIHHLFKATVVGIEMNEKLYQEALKNRSTYGGKSKIKLEQIHFHCCLAEEYEIDPQDNRFYFFNPFSIQIFMGIIHNILLSAERNIRDIEIVLYYGSEEYMFFLENHTFFEFKEEIIIPGVYERNSYERFLIYRLAI
ncbi:methyltransferase [Bacillus sp. FJAT-50079]|uniref:methyltransferase n=1 Tax=Bacillus sp. FJAT-50079 TaxID=2833577 RepID=UPI001BC8F909|nr:methyltransferase [Bacillus sp. FJAT-50079]MBS4209400.1 methyltransferase [Bacillus sp. FJAT-50079]